MYIIKSEIHFLNSGLEIGTWLGILLITIGLIYLNRKIEKRNEKILEFSKAFSYVLLCANIRDLCQGIKSKYTLDDLDTLMWDYNKMVWRFWVQDYRKMFYDQGLFDYVYDYAIIRHEELDIQKELNSQNIVLH